MRPHLSMLCCAALLALACNDRTSDSSTISTGDMDAADQTSAPDADMSTPDLDADSDLDAAPDDDADQDAADAGDTGVDMVVEPGLLTVALDRAEVRVGWTVPPAASLVLRRRLNAPVAGADDADAALLIEGADPGSLAHATSELLPDTPDASRTYHYALFACDQAGACALAAPQVTLTLTLTQALQGGGYNLIWRHATASSCADRTELGNAATTSSPDWWRSCSADCAGGATARQLTEPAASAELAAVRDFMAQQTIPFGRTLSSEFCRCFKTAEGFELGPNIELDRKLTFFVHDEAQRCVNTYLLLNTPTPAATNVAMVGHAGFTCPTLDTLAWGEAAIFKPDAQGEPLLVARVLADGWAALP